MSSLLPPRFKDWKPGTIQLGIFVRTRKGTKIEASLENGADLELKILLAVTTGMVRDLSPEVQRVLLEELARLHEEAKRKTA